jgi:hypothetical protein
MLDNLKFSFWFFLLGNLYLPEIEVGLVLRDFGQKVQTMNLQINLETQPIHTLGPIQSYFQKVESIINAVIMFLLSSILESKSN